MRKNKPKFKRYQHKRALRKARHEYKRRARRRKLKLIDLPTRKRIKKYSNFINNPDSAEHDTHVAPEVFSLIEDPESVMKYIEASRESLKRGVPVHFDLSNIQHITPETLMLLCALFTDPEFTMNTPISGNAPKDLILRKMFIDVGFYKFVRPRMGPIKQVEDVSGKIIHRVTRTNVDPDIAADITKDALAHTLKINDLPMIKKHVIYPILIECMSNTKDHSNYGKEGIVYNWWIFAYKETETQITKICFLDLGVGIFGSLKSKYFEHKLVDDLFNYVFPEDNIRTIKMIFKGENKRTSTEKLERGLGLHDIHEKIINCSNIQNFTLISNDVIVHVKGNSDKITKLNKNFMGTMYYFELTPEKND